MIFQFTEETICQFTDSSCRYIKCPLWSERLQACKHALAIDKLLGNENKPFPTLTTKEWKILNLIAQGYSNKQIALATGMNSQTVKNHITDILRKLGAKNRTEALVIGLKHGAVSIERSEN